MELDFKIVGKNIRRIVAERNITLPMLSYMTKVPLTSLRSYIYFKAYPTSKQLQKIAKGLKIEVGDLFKTTEGGQSE